MGDYTGDGIIRLTQCNHNDLYKREEGESEREKEVLLERDLEMLLCWI